MAASRLGGTVPTLERMRVLTEADDLALASFYMQFSTMVKAQRLLEKSGLLFKTTSGYIQQSPLVAIVANSVEQVNKLCREFGLTPSSRTRLSVEKEKDSGR
jgi:P27 family predicted phage terminase small subunit